MHKQFGPPLFRRSQREERSSLHFPGTVYGGWESGGGSTQGAKFEHEDRFLCRPSAALNPVFVLPTTAAEVFHFIYLLFISLQLPKINDRH